MIRSHLVILGTTALLVLAMTQPAFACAVCFDANEETRGAFLGTTIFLSLFPLGMIFGIGYWLWRRATAIQAEESAART